MKLLRTPFIKRFYGNERAVLLDLNGKPMWQTFHVGSVAQVNQNGTVFGRDILKVGGMYHTHSPFSGVYISGTDVQNFEPWITAIGSFWYVINDYRTVRVWWVSRDYPKGRFRLESTYDHPLNSLFTWQNKLLFDFKKLNNILGEVLC